MSPSADHHPQDAAPADRGFTLIEVIVALGLTLVVMAALLPQLIVGIRGTAISNDATEAKGVLQGQLERMRGLPFHVAPAATPTLTPTTLRRLDVLDTYFPDNATLPSPTTPACLTGGRYTKPLESWSGYVPAATTRCSYEPGAGSFYRRVDSSAFAGYVIVTDTQFLDSVSRGTPGSPTYQPIVAETTGTYNSQVTGQDTPVSSQIGVTATVFSLKRSPLRPVSAYTQISEVVRSPTRVLGIANARALEVGGITTDQKPLSLSAGEVNISGSLTRASTASVGTAAVTARKGTDDPVGPRLPAVLAPPTATVPTASPDSPAGTMSGATCPATYACWGPATLDPLTASADGGLPNVTGVTGPVEARVTDTPGVSFRNTVDTDLPLLRPDLDLASAQPMVGMSAVGAPITASACGTSRGGWLSGRGYLQTTTTKVATCSGTATSAISLFPTNFAPAGVVRLTLTQAWAKCIVDRAATPSRTAQAAYQLKVEYADPAAAGGYTAVTVTGDSSLAAPADPLTGLLTKPVGGNHMLGDYIDSWKLSAPTVATTSTTASASLPGVVKLISQPLRTSATGNDASSAISLALGAVSCDAEDAR